MEVSWAVWSPRPASLDMPSPRCEVVTGLAYLEITRADRVEYSGLMIDGERIVGMQVDFRVPLRP